MAEHPDHRPRPDEPPPGNEPSGSSEPTEPTELAERVERTERAERTGRTDHAEPAPRSQDADDAAFLDLVARFDQEPDPAGQRWPTAEDGLNDDIHDADLRDGDLRDGDLRAAFVARPPRSDDIDTGDIDTSGTDVRSVQSSDDHPGDHYVPPPAPPMPRMRPVTRWALGSIALGMAILVAPTLVGFEQSGARNVTGVLLILGGVGTLVARMGDRPPTAGDGPDDGAVV